MGRISELREDLFSRNCLPLLEMYFDNFQRFATTDVRIPRRRY